MPELALMYGVGVLVSLGIGIIFGIKQRSKYHQQEYLCLQNNLRKLNLRWSELNLSIERIPDGKLDMDLIEYNKARTTSFFLTSGAAALSWIGAGFLMIIWLSLKFLINSRDEKKLKNSEIAKVDLNNSEIQNLLNQLDFKI
jgi:hypothetical protein